MLQMNTPRVRGRNFQLVKRTQCECSRLNPSTALLSSYRPAGRFNRACISMRELSMAIERLQTRELLRCVAQNHPAGRKQASRFLPTGNRRPQLSRYAPAGASEMPTGDSSLAAPKGFADLLPSAVDSVPLSQRLNVHSPRSIHY